MQLKRIEQPWSAVCLAVIASAAVLRFVNLSWMEFKEDEFYAYMFAVRTIKIPTMLSGLPSSIGVYNPPFFVYLLILPVLLFHNPVAVAACIGLLNLLGLYGLYVLLRRVASFENALAVTALFASAPWPVFFSRKIWAQDVLFPFLVATFLLLDENRLRRPGWMILFGLTLAATTQLHMSAWFLLVPLLAWMLLVRFRVPLQQVLLGVAVFIVCYIPYVEYLFREGFAAFSSAMAKRGDAPHELIESLRWSIRTTTGLGFEYLLGAEGLSAIESWFGVTPALWVFRVYAVVAVCGLVFGAWRAVETVQRLLHKQEVQPIDRFVTLLMLIYVGIQITYFLLRIPALPHYQIIFYPTVVVCTVLFMEWLAQHSRMRMLWLSKALLVILMAANLWFTANALIFIRTSSDSITGDYGQPYATKSAYWQQNIEEWTAKIK
jgi:hypothetical protein